MDFNLRERSGGHPTSLDAFWNRNCNRSRDRCCFAESDSNLRIAGFWSNELISE